MLFVFSQAGCLKSALYDHQFILIRFLCFLRLLMCLTLTWTYLSYFKQWMEGTRKKHPHLWNSLALLVLAFSCILSFLTPEWSVASVAYRESSGTSSSIPHSSFFHCISHLQYNDPYSLLRACPYDCLYMFLYFLKKIFNIFYTASSLIPSLSHSLFNYDLHLHVTWLFPIFRHSYFPRSPLFPLSSCVCPDHSQKNHDEIRNPHFCTTSFLKNTTVAWKKDYP